MRTPIRHSLLALLAWWLTPWYLSAPNTYDIGLASYASNYCVIKSLKADGSPKHTWAIAYTTDETVTADSTHFKFPSDNLNLTLTTPQRNALSAELSKRSIDSTWLTASTTRREAIQRILRVHIPNFITPDVGCAQ